MRHSQVIGSAGPLPSAPVEKIQFIEDMEDSDLATAVRVPSE